MLSKHGIEIRSAKTMTRFRRAARNVQWGGVFRGSGAHLSFAEDWRLENNASSRCIARGGLGAEFVEQRLQPSYSTF